MAAAGSAWRANDVVAYDGMREAANIVIASLLRRSGGSEPEASARLTEAAELRHRVLQVSGFDRAAVDKMSAELQQELELLAGHA